MSFNLDRTHNWSGGRCRRCGMMNTWPGAAIACGFKASAPKRPVSPARKLKMPEIGKVIMGWVVVAHEQTEGHHRSVVIQCACGFQRISRISDLGRGVAGFKCQACTRRMPNRVTLSSDVEAK